MTSSYDQYYQTENLFGAPYPELIRFFEEHTKRGEVLDLGCGQGRDSIALARLGYRVTGVDHSEVGIGQMNRIAKAEKLDLVGLVDDIYDFDRFEEFDIILLDSMFHFAKKDKDREVGLIKKMVSRAKAGCLFVICIQDTGKKVEILNKAIDPHGALHRLADTSFQYIFEDRETGHRSKSDYCMLVAAKSDINA